MLNYNSPLFYGIIFLLLSSLLGYGSMYNHELTHKQINKYYGCDSEIHMSLFSAYTISIDDCENKMSETEYASYMMSHNNVEIVGYNIMPLLVLFTSSLCTLMVSFLLKD